MPLSHDVDDASLGDEDGDRASILVVDDLAEKLLVFTTVLENLGHELVCAHSGAEALKEIRKLPRDRELPMVAVTAKAMKGDRQKCIDAGAWDYISKPVDPRYLMSVLRGWLCR